MWNRGEIEAQRERGGPEEILHTESQSRSPSSLSPIEMLLHCALAAGAMVSMPNVGSQTYSSTFKAHAISMRLDFGQPDDQFAPTVANSDAATPSERAEVAARLAAWVERSGGSASPSTPRAWAYLPLLLLFPRLRVPTARNPRLRGEKRPGVSPRRRGRRARRRALRRI